MAGETTLNAGEKGLRRSVQLVDIPARGTSPAGVSGIHEHHLDPRQLGLVFHEGSKLKECPGMPATSLRPSSPNPRADALQVLQGNSSPGAFGLRNQFFGDGVIDVAGEAAFLALALLEEPFGRFGPFLLKPGPELGVPLPKAVQMPAGEGFPIGIYGDVDDSQINPEEVLGISGGRLVHFTDDI